MENTLNILQIVVGVLLIGAVLVQSKGAGLGAEFGGSDNIQTTRRGAEKGLFQNTVVLSAVFLALAAARMFVI